MTDPDSLLPDRVFPVVVCAVVRDGSELLTLLRRYPPGAGQWGLPAGFVEPGESAEQAVKREVREETGLDLRGAAAPVLSHTWGRFADDGRAYLGLFFVARIEGPAEIVMDHESLDHRWIPLRREAIEAVDWAFPTHREAALGLVG